MMIDTPQPFFTRFWRTDGNMQITVAERGFGRMLPFYMQGLSQSAAVLAVSAAGKCNRTRRDASTERSACQAS